MKLFLDTNILLRFFLKDIPDQFEYCRELISAAEEGRFQPYSSAIVFLEISYVLKSVYKLPFEEVLKILDAILTIRNLTVMDKTDIKKALKLYRKYKIKFTDCLIASQLPKQTTLVSFDLDFSKVDEINVKKPQELINGQF